MGAPRDHRAGRIARDLRNIHALDPAAIRRQVLDAIHEVVPADAAAWYLMHDDGERLTLCGWSAVGTGQHAVGRAASATGREPDVYRDTLDIRTPPRAQRSAFLEDTALFERRSFENGRWYRSIAAPNGIEHQQRLLAFHGGRYLGWVGSLRMRGAPPFGREERRRAQPLVGPVIAALAQAEHLERAAQPSEPADFVVAADGRVDYASRAGRAWLAQPSFSPALAALVRDVDSGVAPAGQLGIAAAKVLRLDGDAGVRYLVHVAPLPPQMLSPLADLTPAQREVAIRAAAGDDVEAIGHALGRSAETVRTHLKEVYRKLGVSSRVGLATALAT